MYVVTVYRLMISVKRRRHESTQPKVVIPANITSFQFKLKLLYLKYNGLKHFTKKSKNKFSV